MQLFVFAQNKKWPEFQRFNEVNDDILERREVAMSRKKKPVWLKWGEMAAFLIGTVALPMLNQEPSNNVDLPNSGDYPCNEGYVL